MTPREMLKKLISFNTVSDRSNLELISYVEDYLASHGVESVRVPDETGTKAALHARIGPPIDGGVVLSAHTDVVPVTGQNWSSDPFSAWEEDGRLYGRGSADMLFISHDLAVIRQMCNRIGVMRNGELCEVSECDELFEHPKHPYTRELLDLMPSLELLSRANLDTVE